MFERSRTLFIPALIEYKLGTEAETTDGKEGFRFDTELLREFSKDPAIAKEQKIQREALTLLMASLLHVDNKQENQRIECAPGTVVVEDGVAK